MPNCDLQSRLASLAAMAACLQLHLRLGAVPRVPQVSISAAEAPGLQATAAINPTSRSLLQALCRPLQASARFAPKPAIAPLRRPVRPAAAAAPDGGGGLSQAARAALVARVNKEAAARLAGECGVPESDVPRLTRSIAVRGREYQAALIQHGFDFAAYLVSQGVERAALAWLLQRRTYLFTEPAAPVATSFETLLAVGLTPTEAARALPRHPHGFWRKYNARPSELAERAAYLRQLGFTPKHILQSGAEHLLAQQTVFLMALEVALQRELGFDRRLFKMWLAKPGYQYQYGRPRVLPANVVVAVKQLRYRMEPLVQASHARMSCAPPVCVAVTIYRRPISPCSRRLLAHFPIWQVFGQPTALAVLEASKAELCFCNEQTFDNELERYRQVLEDMRVCGVADPASTFVRHAKAFLDPNFCGPYRTDVELNRLAIQRALGLTPAQVYEQHANLLSERVWQPASYGFRYHTIEVLFGRLLLIEHLGQLPLLVPDVRAAKRQWLRERGLPATSRAQPGQPAFITLKQLARLSPTDFLAWLPASSGITADEATIPEPVRKMLRQQEEEAAEEQARLRQLGSHQRWR